MAFSQLFFIHQWKHFKSCLGCDADVTLIGNGFCNDETNNANCNYDGGDCCVNIRSRYCSECHCLIGGKITSPGYPNHYDNFLNSIWILEVPPGQTIQIHFLHFDLDFAYESSCR